MNSVFCARFRFLRQVFAASVLVGLGMIHHSLWLGHADVKATGCLEPRAQK